MKKLRSFYENPEKYATNTKTSKERVQYLESVKHKFSEGQLATYTTARKKYNTALAAKTKSKKSRKTDYNTILTEAFNNRRSVKIRYKNSWRTIDPYSLNSIYLVAYCHFAHDIRTFKIDRLQGAKLLETFNFDKSLQATAQNRLGEASNYRWHSGYQRRY